MLDDDDVKIGDDDDVSDLEPGTDDTDESNSEPTIAVGHSIPSVPEIEEGPTDEDQFQGPVASPAVQDGEDVFSGESPNGEPADIDKELAKVGLQSRSDQEDSE